MFRAPYLLTVLPVMLVLTGCDADEVFAGTQEKQDFHYNKPLASGGRFSIENLNGSVDISGWEKNEVDISGTKYAKTRELLDEVKIDVQSTNSAVSVRTIAPTDRWNSNAGARYSIRVPNKVLVELASSTNGRIHIERIEGAARIRTTNGGVRTTALKGNLEITTTNGNVEIVDVTGGARVTTSNGSIKADNLHGDFTAKTSNGGISARLFDVPTNSPIKASTTNGGVDLTLDQVSSDVRASTSNGHINLRLPSNANAKVDAHTRNSSVSSELNIRSTGDRSKGSMEGTLGSGGPHIELSTTNGPIRLLKGSSI